MSLNAGDEMQCESTEKRRRFVFIAAAFYAVLAIVFFASSMFSDAINIALRKRIAPTTETLPDTFEGGDRALFGRFSGQSESAIIAKYGKPSFQFNGHYGAPPWDYQRMYPDAVTVGYQRESGIQYFSLCRQDGAMICFDDTWLPAGTVF